VHRTSGKLLYAQGLGVARDPEKAFNLFKAACDAGLVKACVNLGTAYWRGVGYASRSSARSAALQPRVRDG
jgi:TPR repeat protein